MNCVFERLCFSSSSDGKVVKVRNGDLETRDGMRTISKPPLIGEGTICICTGAAAGWLGTPDTVTACERPTEWRQRRVNCFCKIVMKLMQRKFST